MKTTRYTRGCGVSPEGVGFGLGRETFRRTRRAAKRFLRLPLVIVGELAAIALAGVLGASLPRAGTAPAEHLARLREGGPLWAALVNVFALDHVFRSAWFLGLTLLAAASLWLVIVEQVRRLRGAWTQRPTLGQFDAAPFRAEFERPARLGTAEPLVHMWTEKRLGLAGSPMLHVGLLFVILAGALRALFGTEALVDLLEGETLPPTAGAWAAQFPGLLGKPFRLESPLTLNSVKAVRYLGGDLRDLRVELVVQGRRGAERADVAVNHDLKAGGGRVFLGSGFGPAALLEWQAPGAEPKREALLLTAQGNGDYEGASSGPHGLRAYLRTRIGADGGHPNRVEVRVMKGGALLFTGEARVGQTAVWSSGERLVLRGMPFWARLCGSRDSALWLAYAGFAFVLAGATLIFTCVTVAGCVVVTPAGERERVVVALKPQRLAPVFAERFQQLVREQGGPAAREEQGAVAAKPERSGGAVPAARPLTAAVPGVAVLPWLLCFSWVLVGCQRASLAQARQLVERYNALVSEAYRRGDVKLIDPVVGPNEGKKLTGLIGVRLDLGLTLDSRLLSLEVTGVERAKNETRVQTKERWRYRDRRIGSGEPVGQDYLDSYTMLYVFRKMNGVWLVDEIRFTSAPQIGRQSTLWNAARPAPSAVAPVAKPKEVTTL